MVCCFVVAEVTTGDDVDRYLFSDGNTIDGTVWWSCSTYGVTSSLFIYSGGFVAQSVAEGGDVVMSWFSP